jgi:hypothetical protein
MQSGYAVIPTIITSNQITNGDHSFSPSDYCKLSIKNNNTAPLGKLVINPIKGGKEVGSKEYIPKSTHFFIRTKCLSADSFLLDYESDGLVPIRPQAFREQHLIAGDILISKDSNIGETAILNQDLPNFMVSGGIRILKVLQDPYYVYAISKHRFFKQQLEILTKRGATLKHAKAKYLDCEIPFPNQSNSQEVIEYVSLLVKAIMRKEAKIVENASRINELIRKELIENQLDRTFSYVQPTQKEIEKTYRLDASIYSEDYKKRIFLIENYIHGADNIYGWGFSLSRGQNLQVSNIGKSIYSEEKKENYYKLFLPTHLTVHGTVSKVIYLGNKNKLKCLRKGDIIFGAEGFEKGRSVVIPDEVSNTITNIHGITLETEDHDLTESIFVRCFLNFLRGEGLIDKYAVGGNGGSLSIKYWDVIKLPKFPKPKREEIAKLYHNSCVIDSSDFGVKDFEAKDEALTNEQGIIQLDAQKKAMKNKLNSIIDNIILNKTVSID